MQRSPYTIEQIQNNDEVHGTTTTNDDTDGVNRKIEAIVPPQMSWRNRGFTTTTTTTTITSAANKQNAEAHCDSIMDAPIHTIGYGATTSNALQCGQSNNNSSHGSAYTYYNDSNTNAIQPNNNNNNNSNSLTSLAQTMYSEDLRISKILRRLLSENNPTQALILCKKLETAVRNQANTKYICRSFDFLMENMIMVLKQCPEECLEHASYVLGLIGYINRDDFAMYKSFLTRAYQATPQIQKYIMLALKATLSCDAVNLDLSRYSERLLQTLKDFLENSEVAENFIVISETIAEFSMNYKRTFDVHFMDIVDIIVGWHLEVEQPHKLKRHCGQVLQQFSPYFLKNVDFTLGLLGQFLEDIAGFDDDILPDNQPSVQQLAKQEQRIGAFVGAFNSILKCVATRTEFFESCEAVVKIVQQALAAVVRVTKQNFALQLASEETVLSVNDFLCLIIENSLDIVDVQSIKLILELELQLCDKFNEAEQLSMLFMVLCIFRQLKTNLPKSFVTLVLHHEDPSPMTMIKLAQQQRTYRLLLRIYHEILTIKNVPLLQEAYLHVTADIERCITCLKSCGISYETRKSEALLSFYLAALSALATQTSSIISIYALSPSILELLIVHFEAANMDLWHNYSALHEALFSLLLVHCAKNHNFRPTSRLLNAQEATFNSPTMEHFGMIMNFVENILQSSAQLNDASLELLLSWLQKLLRACEPNADVLCQQRQFQTICLGLCGTAKKAPVLVAACLATLLKYGPLQTHILDEIRNVAMELMDDMRAPVRAKYSELYAQLPLAVSLSPLQNDHMQHLQRHQQQYNANVNSSSYAALRQKYFKTMLDYLDPDHDSAASGTMCHLLLNIFTMSCSNSGKRESTSDSTNSLTYQQLTQQSVQLLSMWLQFEAARYCVQNKLRTIIGKPQETFLAIEAVIMKYARSLNASKDSTAKSDVNLLELVETQSKISLLLGFLENLEKLIYNAAEGTAFALAAAEKPAKTFFRINLPTCNEWFKRIRQGVCLIGLHSQQPEMVIRYAECLLLLDKITDPAMEHVLLNLVRALMQCSECEAIHGLHVRLKQHSKRFVWLQYVAEQAAGHLELAAEGYQRYLSDHDKQLDTQLREFLREQLLECLYCTGQWPTIRELDGLVSKHSFQHLAQMEKLCEQYAAATEANDVMHKLTQWYDFEEKQPTAQPTASNYSIFHVLNLAEQRLMCAELALEENDKSALQLALQESLRHGQHSCFNDFVILNHVQQQRSGSVTIDKLNISDSGHSDYKSLVKCLLWSMELELSGNTYTTSPTSQLLLHVAAQERSAGNLKFAQYLLQQFMRCKGYQAPLQQMVPQLQQQHLHIDTSDTHLLQGLLELSKLHLQQSPAHLNDAIDMSASVVKQMWQLSYKPRTPICAEMLLNMADCITQRSANHTLQSPHLTDLLQQLPQLPAAPNDNVTHIIPQPDLAAGTLLNASVWQSPDVADNWYAFGNWCYRWGKKIIEPQSGAEQQHQGKLTARDIDEIKDLIGGELDVSTVLATLNKYQLNINDGIEEIIMAASQDNNSTEQLAEDLRNLPVLADKPTEVIANIIHIWRQAHKGIYSYYELATKAYFRYLAIKTDNQGATAQGGAHVEDSTFVTTTLRLLRLIVKHASGLQDVLEEGLNNTPLRPWKIIIPQLFSRLNHHEPYVRKCVSELLCRLAAVHSHLILFPAVVGARQQISDSEASSARLSSCFSTLLQTLTTQAPAAVRHVELLVRELKRITLLWEEYWLHGLSQIFADYSPIINAFEMECKKFKDHNTERLEAKYAIIMQHIVADVEKLAAFTRRAAETNYERNFQERFTPYIDETIKALQGPFVRGKVTETWLKIKQLYNVFQQRSLRGSSSTLKVSELSPILAHMSNTAIAMPGVDTNEQLQLHIRSVDHVIHILPTKTKPKKLAFYGSNGRKYTYLFKGLEDLHLDERIMQFLAISNSMMARSAVRCKSAMANAYKAQHYSVIPLGPQSGLISWVDHVTPIFAIYKKWQQRDALVKQQQKDRQPNKQPSTTDQSNQNASVTPTATRPSELFFNKLTPLLTAQRIKVTDPRKQWPLAMLRQVFNELSQETPKDLLAKEIWCQSVSAAAWRQAVRNYSNSVAVMSVIGYIIGLGDRHLDNVLIKLTTGEIVHIDYNVCFEKGKTLRIPEKVPFRMTQNLETALGITGVEGAFRLSCEHVLKVLRKEKETLLTLLEAFVYDPLVDWTVNDHEAATATTSTSAANSTRPTTAHIAAQELTKLNASYASTTNTKDSQQLLKLNKYSCTPKKTDLELAKQNIIIRYNEIKPAWTKYKDVVFAELEQINEQIEQLLVLRIKLHDAEKERDKLTQQLSLIRELEALGSAIGSHALNTLTQRYGSYKANTEALNFVKQSMQQQHDNIKKLLRTYFNELIAADASDKLMRIQLQLNGEQQKSLANEFSLVADLLQQNAQAVNLYESCDFARREMDNALYQETHALLECLELLLQYGNVMQYFSRKQIQKNALVHYEQAYAKLLQSEDGIVPPNALDTEKQRPQLNGRVVEYANAMSTIWQQLNYDLEAAFNALNEHKQHMQVITLDSASDAVEEFLSANAVVYTQQFQRAMLLRLNEAHHAFANYEEHNYDPNLLVEQQINFVAMLTNILELLYADIMQTDAHSLNTLIMNLKSALDALYKLKCGFELSLPERILQLFMLDDDAALQAHLTKACSVYYLADFFGLEAGNQEQGKFAALLWDIHNMFTECEAKLCDVLQGAVQHINCGDNFDCSADMEPATCIPKHLKLEAIAALFKCVQQAAISLKEQHLDMVYDIRLLSIAFGNYLTHIEQTKLIGFITTIYNELQTALSKAIPSADIPLDEISLVQLQMLCDNYFIAEQQACLLKQQQREILRCTKCLDHYTLVASAYYWQHLEYMHEQPHDNAHIISREQLLAKLLNNTQTLAAWKHTITKIQCELDEHTLSIKLQLNWHNNNDDEQFNASPKTATISKHFMHAVALQKQHYASHLQMLEQMCDYACVLLQFERYTAFGQQLEAEEVYQTLLAQYQSAYDKWQQSGAVITPVEQSIVQLLDPEGKIDQCWIGNISGLLDDMIYTTQKQISQYERDEMDLFEELQKEGQNLQSLLDMPVRQDVRYLIKSIFKNEKNSRMSGDDNSAATEQIRDFHQALKLFYSNISDLRMKLLQRDCNELNLQQLKEHVAGLLQVVLENHDALLQAMYDYSESNSKANSNTQTPDTLNTLNATAADTDKKLSNSTGEQKRNAYAVSVWKRIRMKLEGRDPDSNRRASVPEQIDYIIRESQNIDNLAVLYEGWTPWV